MSTIILGLIILSAMVYVVYTNYLKKGRHGACDCSSCDCPVKSQVEKSK